MKIRNYAMGTAVLFLLIGLPSMWPVVPRTQEVGANDQIETITLRPKKISAFIVDENGKPVGGLKPEQLRIIEKVPRIDDPEKRDMIGQAVYSAFSGEMPLRFVLLVDTSGSVFLNLQNPGQTRDMKRIINQFIDSAIRPGVDEGLILPFGNIIENHRPFSSDTEWLKREVNGIQGGGATPLFDAILTALNRIEAEEDRANKPWRTAIILLSDGREEIPCDLDKSSARDAFQKKKAYVEARLAASGIPAYVLYPHKVQSSTIPLKICSNAPAFDITRDSAVTWLKDRVARVNSGEFFSAMNTRQREEAFADITERLRQMHWIIFYPSPRVGDETARDIKVEVVIDQGADRPEDKRYKRDNRYRVKAPETITFLPDN